MSCMFDGCGNDVASRGWCHGHYQQQREGRPMTVLRAYSSRKTGTGFCFTCDAVEVMHGRGDDYGEVCAAVGLRPASLLRHVQRHQLDERVRAWAARGVKAWTRQATS